MPYYHHDYDDDHSYGDHHHGFDDDLDGNYRHDCDDHLDGNHHPDHPHLNLCERSDWPTFTF